jgi:predicted metal-binding membrane protein
MWHARRRIDALLAMLGSTSLIAWSVLGLHGSGLALPTFCSAETSGAIPLSVSFDLALLLNSPAKLAAGWALMITAMMSPLLIAPLRHVREQSVAKRRAQAMLLFAAGYMAVWMAAGLALQPAALVARLAEPAPLVCLGCAAAMALLWQISPAKRWCLKRCHRRPHLAAFGAAAHRDAFGYGLVNGAACVGACWALMLVPLLLVRAHLPAMVAVTLFILAERLGRKPLAWQCPGHALRISATQRTHIGLRSVPSARVCHEACDVNWD